MLNVLTTWSGNPRTTFYFLSEDKPVVDAPLVVVSLPRDCREVVKSFVADAQVRNRGLRCRLASGQEGTVSSGFQDLARTDAARLGFAREGVSSFSVQ